MLSEDELTERFRPYGVTRGGEFYMPPPTAIGYVHACESNNLSVVSIETFRSDAESIFPLLDLLADYSSTEATNWSDFRRKCNIAAMQFLTPLLTLPDLLINITVFTQTEWEDAS